MKSILFVVDSSEIPHLQRFLAERRAAKRAAAVKAIGREYLALRDGQDRSGSD